MTNQEKLDKIKELLSKYVAERVKDIADGAVLRSVDADSMLDEFEQRWLENYHGEEKIPHYILREFIKYIEAIHKPYNVPYVLDVNDDSWYGEEPDLLIIISSEVHNLLGSIEVNVYERTSNDLALVECEVRVDDERNISIRSATRFSGKIEVFCSVGETPELQHRQPVYTFNDIGPDESGNISIEALSDLLIKAHNDDPDAHEALLQNLEFIMDDIDI
jgi:hypothetical protein